MSNLDNTVSRYYNGAIIPRDVGIPMPAVDLRDSGTPGTYSHRI